MKRIPIIIDVDTGTDDAICITSALLNQEHLDIKAFTTVCGNVSLDKTSRNTLNIVEYLGEKHPVALGAAQPLVQKLVFAISHGSTGLGDVQIPQSGRPFLEEPAWEVMYHHALQEQGELELLAVGPLTNVALAIRNHPDIVPLIRRITIMGGCLVGGNMTPTSEFNIYNDPEAAKIVFESGIEMNMIGLDVTLKPSLPEYVVEAVGKLSSHHGDLVTRIFSFMKRRAVEYGGDAPNLHDVIALAAILKPEMFTMKDYYITVELNGDLTRGMTVADFRNVSEKQPNAHAAVDIDINQFWAWFIETMQSSEHK
ncbi:MAG: nucleoside hydrolase [Lachnospiraceae bacterium]|jgi:pyrimidine-specific ribonucleoside hydrolase